MCPTSKSSFSLYTHICIVYTTLAYTCRATVSMGARQKKVKLNVAYNNHNTLKALLSSVNIHYITTFRLDML